jgi:hypothetical protein
LLLLLLLLIAGYILASAPNPAAAELAAAVPGMPSTPAAAGAAAATGLSSPPLLLLLLLPLPRLLLLLAWLGRLLLRPLRRRKRLSFSARCCSSSCNQTSRDMTEGVSTQGSAVHHIIGRRCSLLVIHLGCLASIQHHTIRFSNWHSSTGIL